MMIPGEYFPTGDAIIANKDKKILKITVANTGDRPIQVGSHTHFSEANKALEFDREKSLGFHLNISAGTSIRFEPGESKHVQLVEFGGNFFIVNSGSNVEQSPIAKTSGNSTTCKNSFTLIRPL